VGSTPAPLSVTVDLAPATLRRLEAEAAPRGVGIEAVIAELAEALPAVDTGARTGLSARCPSPCGCGY